VLPLLVLLYNVHRHDLHGIIGVQTAQLMEEVAETPAPVTAPDATAATATDSMDVEGKESESKGDSKVLLLLLYYTTIQSHAVIPYDIVQGLATAAASAVICL
jgi:hypothetical protein